MWRGKERSSLAGTCHPTVAPWPSSAPISCLPNTTLLPHEAAIGWNNNTLLSCTLHCSAPPFAFAHSRLPPERGTIGSSPPTILSVVCTLPLHPVQIAAFASRSRVPRCFRPVARHCTGLFPCPLPAMPMSIHPILPSAATCEPSHSTCQLLTFTLPCSCKTI